MAFNLEQFQRVVMNNVDHYEIIEWDEDGREHHYRGRNISAFFAKADARLHEHKVFTKAGHLVYHRDASGFVHVGNDNQVEAAERKRARGSYLLWGARGRPDDPLGEIVRNGVRLGLGGFGKRRR